MTTTNTNSNPGSTMHATLRSFLVLVAVALAAFGVTACGDEEPANDPPVLSSGAATCDPSMNPDLDGEVLVGVSVQVLDKNLEAVWLDVGGLEAVMLTADDIQPLADMPQSWSAAIPAESQVLCNSNLVLVFTARDVKGETATLTLTAQ